MRLICGTSCCGRTSMERKIEVGSPRHHHSSTSSLKHFRHIPYQLSFILLIRENDHLYDQVLIYFTTSILTCWCSLYSTRGLCLPNLKATTWTTLNFAKMHSGKLTSDGIFIQMASEANNLHKFLFAIEVKIGIALWRVYCISQPFASLRFDLTYIFSSVDVCSWKHLHFAYIILDVAFLPLDDAYRHLSWNKCSI